MLMVNFILIELYTLDSYQVRLILKCEDNRQVKRRLYDLLKQAVKSFDLSSSAEQKHKIQLKEIKHFETS